MLSYTIFLQVLIILVLIMIGFIITKKGMLSEEGVKQLTNILLSAVTPCVLINAYQKEFNARLVHGLIEAMIFTIVFHIIAIIIMSLVFRKESTLRYRINIFTSIYSNCGFMAIPLLSASLGSDGVFYGSAYLAVFTIFYWTHGVYVYCGGEKKEISLKKMFLNPGVIGTLISLFFFIFSIKLPYVINESVKYIASLNTPLAMIILGSYIVKIDIKKSLKNISMYAVLLCRLIILPLIAILILNFTNFDKTVAQTVLISSACPSAAVSTLFATKYNLDSVYSSEIVAISTIFSVITIPLILIVFEMI